MDFLREYLNKMKEIQVNFLRFIDENDNIEENYRNLIQLFIDHKIKDDKYDLKSIIYLIVKISNNHVRNLDFFDKIKKILQYLKSDIAKYYSNFEIFKLLKSNKILLLYAIQEKMINFDFYLADKITNYKFFKKRFPHYLLPELKPFFIPKNLFTKYDSQLTYIINYKFIKEFSNALPENFEEKRKNGENDEYICELMRKDMIEEFIIYVNKNNYPLNSIVQISTYETNSFLLKKAPTLIQYAVFFGSVQIFKYLFLNYAKYDASLWIYAIHGNTPEIIHILEENKLEFDDKIFEKCVSESIKCHLNNITYYLLDLYNDKKLDKSVTYYCLKYYNFELIDDLKDIKSIFLSACQYDYLKIVENFIKIKAINVQDFTIFNLIYFNVIPIIFSFKSKYDISRNEITPFQAAAIKDNGEIIEFLLTTINEINIFSFTLCNNLTSLKIPQSIKKIRISAFENSPIEEITFPSKLELIENLCFSGCKSLKQITIPSSVKSIGNNAFSYCTSLVSVTFELPSSLDVIHAGTFKSSAMKEIIIPSSIKNIESDAFGSCHQLKKVEIPSSVTSISKYAFYDCISLDEISIPSSVTIIGQACFQSCVSLKQVIFNSKINVIDISTFEGCYKLVKITIPSSVKKIGIKAFSSCNNLRKIEIPSSVTLIESHAFQTCQKLTEITIPSSVTSIQNSAFQDCISLKQICFQTPSLLSSIEKCTFKSCSSLQQIEIPASVTSIKQNAFEGCSSLTDIVIPPNVTTIGSNSFSKCLSLKLVSIPCSVQLLENNVFYKCNSIQQIYAPRILDLSGCGIQSNVNIIRY